MKPQISFLSRTGVRSMLRTNSIAVCTVASEVLGPRTTSQSCMTVTGWKKCMLQQRPGADDGYALQFMHAREHEAIRGGGAGGDGFHSGAVPALSREHGLHPRGELARQPDGAVRGRRRARLGRGVAGAHHALQAVAR